MQSGEKVVNETKASENRKRRRRDGGWDASNPRQEKRRQKGLEGGEGAAYNSDLMARWTRGEWMVRGNAEEQ